MSKIASAKMMGYAFKNNTIGVHAYLLGWNLNEKGIYWNSIKYEDNRTVRASIPIVLRDVDGMVWVRVPVVPTAMRTGQRVVMNALIDAIGIPWSQFSYSPSQDQAGFHHKATLNGKWHPTFYEPDMPRWFPLVEGILSHQLARTLIIERVKPIFPND